MKLKLTIALIATAIAINLNDAKAQTSSPTLKAAEEMLTASGGKEQFEKSMDAAMSQSANSLPEDKRAKFSEVMKAFMAKYINWDAIKPELCQVYAHEFTVDELKQLTAFYKSPIGKKIQEKLPLIMQTTMSIGQKAVAAHQAELQQMMMEAMK